MLSGMGLAFYGTRLPGVRNHGRACQNSMSTKVSLMHGLRPSNSPLQRLQARATLKPINFICIAPDAKEVFLSGDFNDWDLRSHPMKRNVDGSWHLSVSLGHGGHHYQFLVDGKRVNDPRAQGLARNEAGEKVSMLLVS